MMFRLSKSRNGLSTKAATPVYSTLAIDLQNSELDALLAVRSLVLVVPRYSFRGLSKYNL